MKYQLRQKINPTYSVLETILTNRHIPFSEITHYMNTTEEDINSPLLLGEDKLAHAADLLQKHIQNNDSMLIIVDCDCDGFTSAALLSNYLYDLNSEYTKQSIQYFIHEGKQHGLSDAMAAIEEMQPQIVIVPDAGSNDYEQHKILIDNNIDLIILDHHLADHESSYGITINNQLSDYPNKELSGVGIVWQFCRYLDSILKNDYTSQYLDLVALGLTGDMMSLTSFETKHLIQQGFEPQNIHNPYIYEMWQKNKFKLGDHITSIDAAFYIVPMINAIQRSGEKNEKVLLFSSMLKYMAFEKIPSTKRGHALGELERIVDQAVRVSTNVKSRQTKAQDSSIEFLKNKIEAQNLLQHKVLLFLLEPGDIDRNIAGLIANKFMAIYQRPCCILTHTEKGYEGSARGYDQSGITNFKDICSDTECTLYAEGHEGAFGLGLQEDKIEEFLHKTDIALKDMSAEPIYHVDYIYNGSNVSFYDIVTIAGMNSLWGKDFEEAMIVVKDLKVSKDMVSVFRKTSNTLKITLPNKINIMKFNATDEECYELENQEGAYIQIDLVGTCNLNEWMGNYTPQIFITDYEITGSGKYLF